MKIGEAHQNVRSASFKFFFCLSANIGTPHTPSPASKCVPPWHQRGGHNHLWVKWLGSQFRQLERKPSTLSTLWTGGCPPPPIGNDDQARCPNNFVSCSVRHSYWRRVHRCQKEWRNIRKMLVFGAPRLFSSQSPIT